MAVYRLTVAYDGSGFHGYARQREQRTVQGELESALAEIADIEKTSVAGRTDAGVHALGQVVSFAADVLDSALVLKRLNGLLPPEIVVLDCEIAADDFDARFSATSRSYRYRILARPQPDPLRRHVTWHRGEPLDVSRMNAGTVHLVGSHDFASFCRRAEGRSTTRTVLAASWEVFDDELRMDITAHAFCHQQVRSITALCYEIGRGRVDPDAVPGILGARDRNAARGAAPAHGLTLMEVTYD